MCARVFIFLVSISNEVISPCVHEEEEGGEKEEEVREDGRRGWADSFVVMVLEEGEREEGRSRRIRRGG